MIVWLILEKTEWSELQNREINRENIKPEDETMILYICRSLLSQNRLVEAEVR